MHLLSCRSSCADQFQIPFSGNSKSSFVTVPWVPEGFFPSCWQRKLSGEIFAANNRKKNPLAPRVTFQRHAFETIVRLRSWTFLIPYFYLFLFLSSFCLLISGLVPEALGWLLLFEEELRSIISVCHLPERPFPSPDRPILFFLGKLRIQCLIGPILLCIAEKRDLCDFLTCEKHF